MGADNRAPALLGRKTPAIKLGDTLFHGGRQLDAFNSTDLRKPLATERYRPATSRLLGR
jgi:hypothetical protein